MKSRRKGVRAGKAWGSCLRPKVDGLGLVCISGLVEKRSEGLSGYKVPS